MHDINYLGLPRCKTCEICLCFLAIVKARVYNADFFLSFVLHNAPINVKLLGGGGGRAKAGDLTVVIAP